MDDLSGLNWSANSNSSNGAGKPPPMSSSHLFPSMPTTSGRSTPLSGSPAPSNPLSKPATPANDSFANLVSFNSSNPDKNLSLVERQKKLQEERARKEAENRTRYEAQYGTQNNQFWDSLEQAGSKPPAAAPAQPADDDDLLSAFNASAPVDASTHFPVPSPSPTPSPHVQTPKPNGTDPRQGNGLEFPDDDDPFGLNQLNPNPALAPAPPAPQNDDDDFLGLLGKPVSEFARPEPEPSRAVPSSREKPLPPKPSNGVDRAVAELVDMGFPADKASQALSTTESGADIQAAVGWLLNQAHTESRQKARGRAPAGDLPDGMERETRGRDVPSWMREEEPPVARSRSDNRSPGTADQDASQVAANLGNNLWKTANTLWKTGSKRVQQVVNEMNTEHDPNSPRWMRDASVHEQPWPQEQQRRRPTPEKPSRKAETFTDEALLLEQGAPPPPLPRRTAQPHDGRQPGAGSTVRPQRSPAREQNIRPPAFMQQQQEPQGRDPKSSLRKAVEEQSTQAYVSPARRKRPAPQPPAPESVDLFESDAPSKTKPSAPPQRPQPSPSATLPTRPKAPRREIPSVSQDALVSTHRQRERGTEAYKRGDYAIAHEAFSAALTMLPDKHPVNIILHGNHAMTALKIGEPKSAIVDADAMLEVIGPSKGEEETIDPGNGEPSKPMRDSFGKALMRKAEALEQLEKWGDAATTWRLAVHAGHGGSTSIQARNRCEQAAGIGKPAPKPSAKPAPKKPAAPKATAFDELSGAGPSSTGDSAAVGRLRAANQEAERADDEKFALSDSVDTRLAAWKNGKQDNLRALLGSLDTILWPEAGWKKVNMSELVLPNKVKVQYMKGISKVHPDKLATDATTEQRMIAGAVFGTLNEAWDKFRKENNL
ncbi:UBA TS-N domain protein [Aspergillus sp. HF37]|nr:UBA TS-N domain protein [Aspergillus sp. HF37]